MSALENNALLMTQALQAVRETDVTLSSPSEVMIVAASSALESVAQVALPAITEQLVASMPRLVMDAVASAVGSVGSVIPAIGSFISFFADLIGFAESAAAAEEANRAQDCQQSLTERAVRPSGSQMSGCLQCPCDIFAEVLPWAGVVDGHGVPVLFRSLLGEALICVTEGVPIDNAYSVEQTKSWYEAVLSYSRIGSPFSGGKAPFTHQVEDRVYPATALGIPKERRELFRLVRLAIESAYRPAGSKEPTDAGQALWPVYLDMLLHEIDVGRLDWMHAADLIGNVAIPKTTNYKWNGKWDIVVNNTHAECYRPTLVPAVWKIASGWRNTVKPRYEPAVSNLVKLREQMRSAGGPFRLASLALAIQENPKPRRRLGPIHT